MPFRMFPRFRKNYNSEESFFLFLSCITLNPVIILTISSIPRLAGHG
jgi:hypothetical protein